MSKNRDLRNLLNRAAAALETPKDLNAAEVKQLVEDLVAAGREGEQGSNWDNTQALREGWDLFEARADWCEAEYERLYGDPDDKWADNSIQFPRLLAEIMATQDQLDMLALAQSMDLSVDEVRELFDRAQEKWEQIKENTR